MVRHSRQIGNYVVRNPYTKDNDDKTVQGRIIKNAIQIYDYVKISTK